MNGIRAMAKATFREALRMRALHIVVVFAIVAIAAVQMFEAFSPGEEEKFIIDTGINLIRLFHIAANNELAMGYVLPGFDV